jgi:hypothetical protein
VNGGISDARSIVGDLAVEYAELAARHHPIHQGNTAERFARWYAFSERILRLSIEAGLAVVHAPAPPDDALAVLRAEIERDEGFLLDAMHGWLEDGLGYIGYEHGWFYGGQAWEELTVFRSGLGFLVALGCRPLDLAHVDDVIARFGLEMFVAQNVPDGMPREHWWWFQSAP